MSILLAGLRSLGVSYRKNIGVLTNNTEVLDNDFFVNLLDMDIEWKRVDEENRELFEGYQRNNQSLLFIQQAGQI